MKKRIKRILVGIAAFFCVVIMTGCTKSFCTVSDTAAMYSSTLTATKQTDIINQSNQIAVLNTMLFMLTDYYGNQKNKFYDFIMK